MAVEREAVSRSSTDRANTGPRISEISTPLSHRFSDSVLDLQRSAGNQAVLSLFGNDQRQGMCHVEGAAELHERPANRRGVGSVDTSDLAIVRRTCSCGGSEGSGGKCSTCREKQHLQRSSEERNTSESAPTIVGEVVRSPGHPLDAAVRTLMESRFGHDFHHIRVSADDRSARAADSIQARAFAWGNRIVFGRNEYDPHSFPGLSLIAHELAHTAQQGAASPSPQASLRIGSVDDPQEREADLAADAVLRAGQVPLLNASGPAVRRQPKVGYTWEWKGDDGIYKADGVKYIVTRKFKPVTRSEKTKLTPGAQGGKAFVRVTWCRNPRRGQVELGVDTARLQQLLPQLLSASNPVQVLQQANLTPYIQLVVIQSEKGTFTFGVQADVGQQGVAEVRGGFGVETRWGKIDITGGVQLPPGQDPVPNVAVTVRPGGQTERVDCETTTFEEEYECSKDEYVPPSEFKATTGLPVPDRIRYIYFDYSKDIVVSPSTKYGKDHREVVARNKASFEDIKRDFGEGFRITAIEGYTSPEGPMDPKGKFEGNEKLSEERAVAALNFIADPLCFPRRDEVCFAGGKAAIKPVGRGEEPYTSEKEGKKLAESAVPKIVEGEGSELKPQERRALEQKSNPIAQAEIVYPLLRRAKITLRRGWVETPITLSEPGGMKTTTVDCPADVLQAAKLHFARKDGKGGQSP